MTWNGWQLNWWPVDSESDTLTTTTNWYMTVKTVVVVVVVACAVRVSTSSCLLFFSHLVPIHTLNTVSRLITSHSTHETFKCCSFVWIIGHLCTLHSISVQFTISRTGASVLCLPSSHWCHQATDVIKPLMSSSHWCHQATDVIKPLSSRFPSSTLSASSSHSVSLMHKVLLHVIYLQCVLHNWRILHTPFICWQTLACIKQPFREPVLVA